MRLNRGYLALGVILLAAIIGLAVTNGFGAAPDADRASSAKEDDIIKGLRVSGPVVHKNLAVYFLHSQKRDDRNFLTLNEGLSKGLVKVTEMKDEQVSRLTIENLSDDPLFLQEGDRVTGGKQDRTIYSSLIIAPKSGKQEIPAFCVEPSRWQEGDTGKAFIGNANHAYAANSVRSASKLLKDQSRVWENVAQTKAQLMKAIGTLDKTSSLNEAQDSKRVAESTKPFIKALSTAADKHSDLVGMAFAVNGNIQEVNVYPGRAVTKTIYPRLLETYALDAIVQAEVDKKAAKAKAPSKEDVEALLRTSVKPKAARDEKINGDNDLRILAAEKLDEETKTRVYRCLTKYKGQPVHLQWINGPESIKEAAQRGESQQRGQFNNLNPDDFQQVEPQRGNRSNETPQPRQQQQQRQRSD